jgi:hypothetical protein
MQARMVGRLLFTPTRRSLRTRSTMIWASAGPMPERAMVISTSVSRS